jgi:hypothetical protein
VEDPRVRQLRELLAQANQLQRDATALIAELTDQIQRSIFTHDDRGGPRERRAGERRLKPRIRP